MYKIVGVAGMTQSSFNWHQMKSHLWLHFSVLFAFQSTFLSLIKAVPDSLTISVCAIVSGEFWFWTVFVDYCSLVEWCWRCQLLCKWSGGLDRMWWFWGDPISIHRGTAAVIPWGGRNGSLGKDQEPSLPSPLFNRSSSVATCCIYCNFHATSLNGFCHLTKAENNRGLQLLGNTLIEFEDLCFMRVVTCTW